MPWPITRRHRAYYGATIGLSARSYRAIDDTSSGFGVTVAVTGWWNSPAAALLGLPDGDRQGSGETLWCGLAATAGLILRRFAATLTGQLQETANT
jgi:hypothetical protein